MMTRTRFDAPCRIRAEVSADEVCAHVELEGGIEIGPGDRVRVHGAPIHLGFGETRTYERMATIERATLPERLWARVAGHFQLTELFEVSFTGRSLS